MDMLVNDDHCESFDRFEKDELHNLIENKLGLDEGMFVHTQCYHVCRFHREELFEFVLNKLAFGLPRTCLADHVFGGGSLVDGTQESIAYCDAWTKGMVI